MDEIAWPFETDRLSLRSYQPNDLHALWAFEKLAEVQRWLGWVPHSKEELARALEDPSSATVHVMVCLDSAVIGHVLLMPRDSWAQTEVAEQAKGLEAELGWMFDPEWGGRGYATEAVRAVVGLCFEQLELRRVHAGCFADNVASWRLMERIGMRREEHSRATALHRDGTWHDGMNYGLLREEWRTGPA